MPRSPAIAVVLLLSAGSSLAQTPGDGIRPGPSVLRVWATAETPSANLGLEPGDTTRSYPRTYWLEGALVGGGVVGLLGTILAAGFCADADSGGGDEPCWDNALLGAAVGVGTDASLGALLGGLIPKPQRQEADSLSAR